MRHIEVRPRFLQAEIERVEDVVRCREGLRRLTVVRGPRVGVAGLHLQAARETLGKLIDKADTLHEEPEKLAKLLTKEVSDAMQTARHCSDALELVIADERWPLPKYREMLFPV